MFNATADHPFTRGPVEGPLRAAPVPGLPTPDAAVACVDAMASAIVTGDEAGFLHVQAALHNVVAHRPVLSRPALARMLSFTGSLWFDLCRSADATRQRLCQKFEDDAQALRDPSVDLLPGGVSGLSDVRASLQRRAMPALPQPAGAGATGPQPRSGPRQGESVSDREVDVLAGVARGLTNKQIAQQLGLSPNTIKRHMTRVMQRLGLPTRSAAAVWYMAVEGHQFGVRGAPAAQRPVAPCS